MEYAFEGDSLEGDAQPSIFTSAIVEGLESGDADYDGDSRISIDELYDYVYDRVRETTPSQTPSKWTFDVHGDLYVARSPYREPKPVPLPTELQAAIGSPFAHVRAGAVEELAVLSRGTDAGLAAAARTALAGLIEDDSKRVSDAASRALAGQPRPSTPPAVVPAPTRVEAVREDLPAPVAPPQGEPTPRAGSRASAALVRAAGRQSALALVGAALLVFGYFRQASWETAWYFAKDFDAIWWVWSPLDVVGVVLLVAVAVLWSRRVEVLRQAADGLLFAAGLLLLVAAVAFVGTLFEFGGTFVFTAIGAAAITAAGALGLLTRPATEVARPRSALGLAAAGAGLGLAPLVVNMADWEKSGLLESQGWGVAYWIEVLVASLAGLVALALLARVPRARLRAGGALIAIGALLALHMVGIVVQLGKEEGTDSIRAGGPLGIVGGVLLLAAGISAVRAEQPNELPAATSVPAI